MSVPELPTSLMPNGAIDALRVQAQAFFTTSGTLSRQLFEWSDDGRRLYLSQESIPAISTLGKCQGVIKSFWNVWVSLEQKT
jgi:hypothetical protein